MWNSRVSRVILLSDSNVEWRLRIIEGAYWFVFWCFSLSAISHLLLMLRGALINIEWGLYHGADIWFFVFQELVDVDNIRIWWLQKHFLITSMSNDVLLKIAKFLWNCFCFIPITNWIWCNLQLFFASYSQNFLLPDAFLNFFVLIKL
jgi:hypothetical protein